MIGQKNLRICRDCLDSIRVPSFFLKATVKMLPIVNEARQRPKTAQVGEASQIPGKNGGGQGSGYYGYGYNGRGQKHKSIFFVDNFGQV